MKRREFLKTMIAGAAVLATPTVIKDACQSNSEAFKFHLEFWYSEEYGTYICRARVIAGRGSMKRVSGIPLCEYGFEKQVDRRKLFDEEIEAISDSFEECINALKRNLGISNVTLSEWKELKPNHVNA